MGPRRSGFAQADVFHPFHVEGTRGTGATFLTAGVEVTTGVVRDDDDLVAAARGPDVREGAPAGG
jgi:hypothetical protein